MDTFGQFYTALRQRLLLMKEDTSGATTFILLSLFSGKLLSFLFVLPNCTYLFHLYLYLSHTHNCVAASKQFKCVSEKLAEHILSHSSTLEPVVDNFGSLLRALHPLNTVDQDDSGAVQECVM
jgi:hypothetical protein